MTTPNAEHPAGTLKVIGLIVAIAASLQTLLVLRTSSNTPEVIAPALIAAAAWVYLWLLQRGYRRWLPPLLVAAVVLAAVVAALAFGSVRTSAGFLFVGAVAGAGIFLGRTALWATVVVSVLALGVLNWAERQGWLHPADFRVGLTVWVTQSMSLVVVAIMVYHSRSKTKAALDLQRSELERRIRSEERFAKAFNFSPVNLTITRLSDGMILEVNRSDNISRGLSPAVLRGRTTLATGAWLDPRARQDFVDRLRRDGRVDAYDSRMRTKDGGLIDVRLWAVLIDIDGQECVLSSTVNVSEEKRREALLLSVAQGMTGETGQAFFDALTRHAALSLKADIVLVGELRADGRIHTLSFWKDGEAAPPIRYDPINTPCQRTLSGHELFVQESGLRQAYPEAPALTALQAEAYVGQCLTDQDATPVGVLAALWHQPVSVTAEMRALMSIFAGRANAELLRMRRDQEIRQLNATLEQRVRQRTAELEKLNAELDSFAYSVSHDLKSPLRAIDGFTRLLGEQLQDRLSAEEALLFDRVLSSTQRMSTLIADLLALARVSQGALELAPTSLSDIAEQVMQAEQAKTPQRKLSWQIEPGLSCICDPRLARIALENLLGNAVKYTRDEQTPLIELRRWSDPGAPPGTFVVRDNGVGFNMAYADKLFKPFQRLHRPSEFDGTGIGLATVHRIVERHGGHVEGIALPGHGAEFRFSFTPVASRL